MTPFCISLLYSSQLRLEAAGLAERESINTSLYVILKRSVFSLRVHPLLPFDR